MTIADPVTLGTFKHGAARKKVVKKAVKKLAKRKGPAGPSQTVTPPRAVRKKNKHSPFYSDVLSVKVSAEIKKRFRDFADLTGLPHAEIMRRFCMALPSKGPTKDLKVEVNLSTF